MSELEGGAPMTPVRPSLAYLEGEGVGIAERDGGAVRQDSADGDVIETSFSRDLVGLQQQLEEKERAAERAIADSLELRNELSAVRAEAATLRSAELEKNGAGPPEPDDPAASPRVVGDALAELAKLRTEAFKSRMELERERKEHHAEIMQARAQYHAAQDELQRMIKVRRTSRTPIPVAPSAAASPPTTVFSPPAASSVVWRRVLMGFVAAVLIAASGFLASRRYPFVTRATPVGEIRQPPKIRPPRPPPKRAAPAKAPTADDFRFAMSPAGRTEFQIAVARLSYSLSFHLGRAPEDVLREVHERYKADDPNICAFHWRNGQPSLLYNGGNLSISQTLQKCAAAVDRSR